MIYMNYSSTRSKEGKVLSAAQAIVSGLADDGGLYVPEKFEGCTPEFLNKLCDMDYRERAYEVLKLFLTDYPEDVLKECINSAYAPGKFSSENITELASLGESAYLLELWRGPTCAFKDMALQLLPHLLTAGMKITGSDKNVMILTATSGDTGKAALEGFKDVKGTKISVFYPRDGVSPMQKRQMITQEGSNVNVCAIRGNFDDAQTAVKTIFSDKELAAELESNNTVFSSANSINWGRLAPQIVYYISAYCDLVKNGEINQGDMINVCVPTGNFGNILAAYYAKKMGLPIAKFICASNKNNVLTDFINTGVYDKNREFFATRSPSMDILISSNLERLIYDMYGCDSQAVSDLYRQLSENGVYKVSDEVKQKISELFVGGWCDDESTELTIRSIFEKYSYLCDTHTAVAVNVYQNYAKQTGDKTKTIIASTASPYKFADSVLAAVDKDALTEDEYENCRILFEKTGFEMPEQLKELKDKKIIHTDEISKDQCREYIKKLAL